MAKENEKYVPLSIQYITADDGVVNYRQKIEDGCILTYGGIAINMDGCLKSVTITDERGVGACVLTISKKNKLK